MPIIALLLVVLGAWPDAAEARRRPRFTRCCLVIPAPDLPQRPSCVQLRSVRRIGPRLACRLLGGRPLGRGDCTLAACEVRSRMITTP
jgi:hypothetical protein